MSEEKIPPSMKIAADVTEEEFKRAKFQNSLVWVLTFALIPLIFFVMLLTIGIAPGGMLGLMAIGCGAHLLLRKLFKESSKMSTLRMKKYKELRSYRAELSKISNIK